MHFEISDLSFKAGYSWHGAKQEVMKVVELHLQGLLNLELDNLSYRGVVNCWRHFESTLLQTLKINLLSLGTEL